MNRKPSARLVQPCSSVLFTGLTRLQQDHLHKSSKQVTTTQQSTKSPAHHTCDGAKHYTSHNTLHHTCKSAPQLSDFECHPHFTQHNQHHTAHQNLPSSGRHTCLGLLHHRDSSPSARPEIKFSSRSSSYEKSSVLSKSASSSKAASPMPSPHLSPRPSPCPSPCPSLITPAASSCSPDRPCSPALSQNIILMDLNHLSADSRQPQRGTPFLS